ncbi:hypothetical protein [Caballeronia sp. TF1N1]|uniref:hypothetical protein n=1 Tax=Caballeronia sp. TF1N1 TaxID=2878153 RepID=UPI001FD1B17B|nr:hypothetical protein [Caballeronia sp. TF1N1]
MNEIEGNGSGEEWSFETSLIVSDASREWLRLRIKQLRQFPEIKKELTSEKLSEQCKDPAVTAQTIHGFIREDSQALNDRSHQDLVRYIWNNHWGTDQWQKEGAAREPAALFHALTHFLGTHQQSLSELSREAPGLYTVWAPSLHLPGKYTKGMLSIRHDEDTGAVEVTETHVFTGWDNTASLKEEFCGFLIKKSRHYVMFTRRRGGQSGPPRLTIIDNTLSDQAQIVVMQGMVTGCYGANVLFSSPIYIERTQVSTDELTKTLDITDDIPESVKMKLKISFSDNVIRF